MLVVAHLRVTAQQPSLPTPVMLLIASLTPLVVLATGVAAIPTVIRDNSHISLPISRHLNHNGKLGIIQRDWKRLNNLVSDGKRSSAWHETHNLPLNDTGIVYSASVGIGDPPTHCESHQFLSGIMSYSHMPISDNLVLDTGSANTWVGANKKYQVTSSSVKTGDFVVRIMSRTDSWPSLS
jgi:cathepsin E